MPNDNFKSRWDLAIIAFALWNCYFVPLQVSFNPPLLNSNGFTAINVIIDFFFMVDIFI